ncbi:MAG: VanW family protein [Acidimicrobiia bacterium]
MTRHRAPQIALLWGAFGAALLFLLASVAWAGHIANAGAVVAPNIRFAGTDVSGASAERAAELVEARSRYLLSTPIIIDTGEGHLVLRADELGFTYASGDVLWEIQSARYDGGLLPTFVSWVTAGFREIDIEDQTDFDRGVARARLDNAPELTLLEPTEPILTTAGTNYVYARPGEIGTGIDVGALVEDLATIDLRDGGRTIQGKQRSLLPTVTDRYADEIADRMNELTRGGMQVKVGAAETTLTTAQLRRHLTSTTEQGGIRFGFDVAGLQSEIEREISGPVGAFEPPVMDVIDGDVVVLSVGEAPPVCCQRDSIQQATEGILAGGAGPWLLEPVTGEESELAAWVDGTQVVDKVGEFTTSHSCCQPRVTNIHRMADLIRGTYLVPGESLSLNEKVRRTRSNGFVADGAIRFGVLTDEVGGGVSQFATTIFNAAYFAGLDFERYKSHSIYFKRYPYGREATVSSPNPDLVIKNTTDYPVLIWTSYDDRNITVTMYSTQNIEVVELGQRVSRLGQCTRVETDRQRTFPDGRKVIDTIEATYRPAEGIDCNGNRIIPTN